MLTVRSPLEALTTECVANKSNRRRQHLSGRVHSGSYPPDACRVRGLSFKRLLEAIPANSRYSEAVLEVVFEVDVNGILKVTASKLR